MTTTEFVAKESTARDRELYRLVDLHASTGAASALNAAATRETEGAAVVVLSTVDAILGGASDSARDQLRTAVLSAEFAALIPAWMRELREVACVSPDSGACTLATAFKLWSWTLEHFRAWGHLPAIDELVEAVIPLIAARAFVLEAAADGSDIQLDLSHVYSARASASTGTSCAELVFGYRTHLIWNEQGCSTCYASDELDDLEALFPGFAAGARTTIDIVEADGSHPAKRGPCARIDGVEMFCRLRNRLDACLTGARVAKDRAAIAIAGRS